MRYFGVPLGMWAVFEKSFQEHLSSEFGLDKKSGTLGLKKGEGEI